MSAKEELIDSALLDALAKISRVNGYQTDIGRRVQPWEFEPDIDRPGRHLADDFLTIGDGTSHQGDPSEPIWTYAFDVQAVISAGAVGKLSEARALAWQVIADVQAALRANADFADLMLEPRVTKKEVPRRPSGSNYLVATISVEIDYYEDQS